ncbi:MAG TPA: glycosyltransferase 87 family protein [Pilimelia sp.]|nr:glycosyltransferase 87 family protein [Pilimelia sp.]
MSTEPRAARRTRTRRQVAVLAAVSVAVGVGLWAYGNKHQFFDLKIYLSALRWWAAGHPLYDYAQPDPVQGRLYFTYPPFAALLLWPFGRLPTVVAIWAFTAGTVAGVVVTTRWLVRPLVRHPQRPMWFVAGLATALVLALESTRETITFGQINMLLVVLVLADLLIAVPAGRRWAGVGIGLAAAIKLFPAIFVAYLLVARRWRAALVAVAAAAAATLLAALVAWDASWQFWTDALWSTERVGRKDYTGNQSLAGLLNRLTAPEPAPTWLWLSAAAAVTAVGLWRAGRAARAGDPLTGLTLTGLAAALASPITWPHHVYWFAPAVVALVAAALADRARPSRRARLLALAGTTYAVAVFGVVSFLDFGTAARPTDTVPEFLMRNAYVLLALVLLVALPVREVKGEPA